MSAANVFNLGADIGAMGASLALIVPVNVNVLTVTFGIISLVAVLFIPYSTYAEYLKWLTLSLFSYVGVVFLVHVSWPAVLRATLIPACGAEQGISDGDCGGARYHNQSLSVFLAGFAGG